MRNRHTYSRFIQNVFFWKGFSKGRLIQLLHHCEEHDITAFDTSDFKGLDFVDKVFGVALSESGLSRDDIQLISKYGSHSGSGDALVESVEAQLLDLGTDYFDLLLLDAPNLSETNHTALEQLKAQGKILEVGGLNLETFPKQEFGPPLFVNLLPSPFTHRSSRPQLGNLTDISDDHTYFIWCQHQPDTSAEEEKVFQNISAKYHIPEQQLYLKWLLQHPAHFHPIICSSEPENITRDVSTKDQPLDPVDWHKMQLILT